MAGELHIKSADPRDFWQYVDRHIVAGLIDRPELTDAKGSRREMTICSVTLGASPPSEGMTPAAWSPY